LLKQKPSAWSRMGGHKDGLRKQSLIRWYKKIGRSVLAGDVKQFAKEFLGKKVRIRVNPPHINLPHSALIVRRRSIAICRH